MAASESVGDSSRDILRNVKRTAKVLLQAATAEEGRDSSKSPKSLDELICEKDALQAEWIGVATDLKLGESLSLETLSGPEGSDESAMNALKQEVGKLEEELLSIKLQSLQEKKLLECLHQHDHLMKHLFPEHSGEDDADSETLVQGIVQQHTELASKLLYNMGELQKTKKDVLALKKDKSDTEYRCRCLMAKLKALDEDDDEDDGHEGDSDHDRTEQLLRKSKDEVTLLKHALLQLIFGSDVDWSKEQELCELVIMLGLRS